MREAEVAVRFEPPGKTVYVLRGTRLIEAAAGAEIVLDAPCGGEGVCGKCRVKVTLGTNEPTGAEQTHLAAEELRAGVRLACQSAAQGPTSVTVLPTSLLTSRHQILVESDGAPLAESDPVVSKRYVELARPRRGDDAADVVRLERALGPLELDLSLLRELPRRLRADGFRGTAVMANGRLLDFEPGDTQSETFAVAMDIGTTTLVGVLLDLGTGTECAVASRLNPQTRFGDDVLSRILYVQRSPAGLGELQRAIIEAVDEMIGELARQAAIPREWIYEIIFAGNTTMQQVLCGIDPSALGEVPFVSTMRGSLSVCAADLGLHLHGRAIARVLPVIGGFVGGDTVAGILATGLAEAQGPTLLVDIGTNGEIVLLAEGKLSAASTAAGPAFEGARILHGMRGSVGAIEKVVVDGRVLTNVIGNVPPTGLCGSALIDVAAELLRHQILTPLGRLQTPDQLRANTLPDLVERLVAHDGRVAFLLAPETETGHGRPIVLTQRDIRELQLAAGAIRAGIAILLRRAGLTAHDLENVYLAGGFGNFIRRNNAQRIGLIPTEVPHRRIRYRGNTSLAGARQVALSRRARSLAEELAARTEHVDLSTDPQFQAAFSEAMIFPDDGSERELHA